MRVSSERCAGIDALLARLEETMESAYSVAWVDLMARGRSWGRAVLQRAEHAALVELSAGARLQALEPHPARAWRVPRPLHGAIGPLSVRLFNRFHYHRPSSRGVRYAHYAPFFFPLDGWADWNRLYGRQGFLQYQFVLPRAAGADGVKAVLGELRKEGLHSFLTVLKALGPGSPHRPLSFPMEGWTLALDLPLERDTPSRLDRMDRVVVAHGGRHYLAKDARMAPGVLQASYPQLAGFQAVRMRHGGERFASLLSDRLGLTSLP
jgi:hypothetical protein